MSRLPRRTLLLAGVLCFALAAITSRAATPSELKGTNSGQVLSIAGLGKGTAPLDGPWQFHLGDDPAFARSETPHSTGQNGWEILGAGQPWRSQGHRSYTGMAGIASGARSSTELTTPSFAPA